MGRVPGSDTSNLPETLVGLAGKLLGSPTGGDSGETVTLGNGNDIDHLVRLEDGVNADLLLKEALSEVDLVGDRSAVDLNFHEVGFLLLKGSLADLSVSQDTDDRAILLDTPELVIDWCRVALSVLLDVLRESLLLALVPVLVEAALDLFAKVFSPDGGEGSEPTGSLDISNDTNANHLENRELSIPFSMLRYSRNGTYWWSLNDGNCLNNLLLVHLGTWPVQVTDNSSHTSLVSESGGEMDGLLGVILRKGLDLTPVPGGTLPGKESERTMAGGFL